MTIEFFRKNKNIFYSTGLIILISIILYGLFMLVISLVTRTKLSRSASKSGSDLKSKKEHLIKVKEIARMAEQELESGKGEPGNWGENQFLNIKYIISQNLIDSQTKITHIKMNLEDFVEFLNECLSCITKNFSVKYSYLVVLKNIKDSNTDADFNYFFKNLYATCNCEDKLGMLLVRLLKQFLSEENQKLCPNSIKNMTECLSSISETEFSSQEQVNNLYSRLESCVDINCPDIFNDSPN